MVQLDLDNFLQAFAGFLAATASVELNGTPRALWLFQADEATAADPYAVLRPYGGDVPVVPVARVQVQCATYGRTAAGAWMLAQKLFNGLLDAEKRPLRMAAINGTWRINGADVRTPGQLGLSETGRVQVIWNCDLRITAGN